MTLFEAIIIYGGSVGMLAGAAFGWSQWGPWGALCGFPVGLVMGLTLEWIILMISFRLVFIPLQMLMLTRQRNRKRAARRVAPGWMYNAVDPAMKVMCCLVMVIAVVTGAVVGRHFGGPWFYIGSLAGIALIPLFSATMLFLLSPLLVVLGLFFNDEPDT